MELLPNLHWIEGRASNIYLWKEGATLVMVDCGMPGDRKKILAYMGEAGLQPSNVVAILVTHADIDHAGAAAELSESCDAPIYASAATADLLVRGKSPKHMPRLIQFINDHFFGYPPVAEDRIQSVEGGQLLPDLEKWQIIATPGHCADHHSFYSIAHGILFAGDALSTRRDRLGLSAERVTADQVAASRSAQRLLQLTPAVFACGHGRPLIDHDAADVMMFSQELRHMVARQHDAEVAGG